VSGRGQPVSTDHQTVWTDLGFPDAHFTFNVKEFEFPLVKFQHTNISRGSDSEVA
jgi:PKD repeat protein